MRILIALLLISVSCTSAQTGMRIKYVSHSTGFPRPLDTLDQTSTAYSQGPLRRIELPSVDPEENSKMVLIQHCDQRIMYVLNLDKREYTESVLPTPEELSRRIEEIEKQWKAGPPNLLIETTVRDTGETKRAFGHTAHHYIKTTKQTASPELGSEPSETVEDEWYLDLPDPSSCDPVSHRPRGLLGAGAGIGGGGAVHMLAKVRPEFKYSGPEPQGLILASRMTTRTVHHLQTGERKDDQSNMSREIVELSEERLNPTLFEVPPGFKKVSPVAR